MSAQTTQTGTLPYALPSCTAKDAGSVAVDNLQIVGSCGSPSDTIAVSFDYEFFSNADRFDFRFGLTTPSGGQELVFYQACLHETLGMTVDDPPDSSPTSSLFDNIDGDGDCGDVFSSAPATSGTVTFPMSCDPLNTGSVDPNLTASPVLDWVQRVGDNKGFQFEAPKCKLGDADGLARFTIPTAAAINMVSKVSNGDVGTFEYSLANAEENDADGGNTASITTTADGAAATNNIQYLVQDLAVDTVLTETVPDGWEVTDISCTANGTTSVGTFDAASASLTIPANTLTQGDELTCLITNAVAPAGTGALAVEKTTASTPANAGETLAYQFSVTNPGTAPVASVVVTDAKCSAAPAFQSGDTNGDDLLQPGESWLYSCTSVGITQDEVDAGQVDNTVAVNGTETDGTAVTEATDLLETAIAASPAFSATKTATTTPVNAGDTITYAFDVTNDGNVSISNLLLSDGKCDGAITFTGGDTDGDGDLDPDETHSYTCTSIGVTQDEVDAGEVDNTVSVSGSPARGTLDPITADNTTPITADGSLNVVKSTTSAPTAAGQTLDYTFVVTNTGNVSITPGALSDPKCAVAPALQSGDANGDGEVNPTETWTYTCTSVAVTQDEVDEGEVANSVSVPGTTPGGEAIDPATDTVTTPVAAAPALSVTKATADVPASEGQTLDYTFTVVNEGNVSISSVAVADAKCAATPTLTGGDTNGDGLLGTTETFVFECTSFPVTQAELDAGTVDNTATVTGNEPDGTALPQTSVTIQTPVDAQPSFTLAKTTDSTPVREGDTLEYVFTLTNDGNVSISGISVTDGKCAATPVLDPTTDTDSDSILRPDEVWTLTCTSIPVTDTEVAAGEVFNSATATGTPSGGALDNATGENTTPILPAPGVAMTKSSTSTPVNAGDTLVYDFVVTNTGNTPLSLVTITDAKCATTPALQSGDTNGNGVLDISEAWGYTCTSIQVTQDEVDAGEVVNSATIDAQDPDGNAAPQEGATSTTPISESAAFSVVKATADTPTEADETLDYTFTLTNDGNVSVSNIVVTDAKCAAPPALQSGDLNNDGLLNPTEVFVYTCTSVPVTQGEIDAGAIENDVSVAGEGPSGDPLTPATDDNTVVVPATPGIEAVKTITSTTVAVDETVTFQITVQNTGNVTLDGVSVTDTLERADGTPLTLTGAVSFVSADQGSTAGNLLPGETATYSASYVLTQQDIDAGGISNSATASGNSPGDTLVEDVSDDGVAGNGDDNPTVLVVPAEPAMALQKSLIEVVKADGTTATTFGAAGDRVDYLFTITNNGNVTLTDAISVADPLITDAGGTVICDPTPLAPGDSLECRGSYVVTQADVDSGGVTNTATAASAQVGPVPEHTASLTVPADGTPALSIVKTPSATSGVMAGETITYTYVVTNTGTLTLTDVTLQDVHTSSAGDQFLTFDSESLTTDVAPVGTSPDGEGPGVWGTLAPGDAVTFVATYEVTQEDVDQEVTLVNEASVSATAPLGLADPTGSDTASVTLEPKAPSLEVIKTVDASNITSPAVVGQQVPFTITIENTGNQTLSAPVLDDTFEDAQGQPLSFAVALALSEGDANTNNLLDVGETWVYTARYDLTQQAIDAGGFDNTVDVTATDPQGQSVEGSGSSDDVILDDVPVLSVLKTAVVNDGGDGRLDENDEIVYTYVVTNTGSVTILDVTLAETGFTGSGSAPVPAYDSGGSDIGGDPGLPDLPVGGTPITYTATYLITQADLDTGAISNQATAQGVSPLGDPVEDVSDDNSNAPGAGDPTVTTLPTTSGITVEKRADASGVQTPAQEGDTVLFTITVRNDGNQTLTAPSLADTLLDADGLALSLTSGPSLSGGDANDNDALDVGETWSYTARFDLTQQAIDAGGITNSVVATTQDPQGNTVRDTSDDDAGASDGNNDGNPGNDPTPLTITGAPGIAIVKTAVLDDGGDGAADAGDTITYTYTVTNTGNQTLLDVTVNETGFGGVGTAPVPAYVSGGAALGGAAGILDLPVGTAPMIFRATYVLEQGDIDAGAVDNQATAAGRDPDGNVLSDLSDPVDPGADSPTETLLPRSPGVAVAKTARPNFGASVEPGDFIDYTITFANTGNVTLTAPTVTDTLTDGAGGTLALTSGLTLDGGDANGNGALDVGETWIYSGRYVLTQEAIDSGGVDNSATGAALDPQGTSITGTDTAAVPITRTPQIGLVKTSSLDLGPDGVASEGDQITYTYMVSNLGNVTVFDIALSETAFSGTGATPSPVLISGGAALGGGAATDLPVGTTPMVFEATYTLTQADVDAGQISNEALAAGTDPDGNTVSDASDDATAGPGAGDPTITPLPRDPGLEVIKTADTSGLASPVVEGNQITFVITAENTGNVSLESVTLTDTFTRRDGTLLSLSPTLSGGDGGVAGVLEVGETWEYRATYTLTQADIDAGGVSNTATVSTQAPGGTPVTDTSGNGTPGDEPTVVTITGSPAITMTKRLGAGASVPFDSEGQLIPFEFVVTNTGSVTLTAPITIDDPLIAAQGLGGVTCPAPPVAPGAEIICTGTYAVTQDDLDTGSFDNSATASVTQPVVPANPGDPTTVTTTTPPSGVTVTGAQTAALQATKAIAPGSATSFGAVGDEITYLFTVTNTGNVTVPGAVTIDDDQIGTGLACHPGPVAPGATVTCELVWTAEQEDIDAGSVTNIASAQTVVDGSPVASDPVSASAPAVQTPGLGFEKTLRSAVPDQFDVGTILTYEFVVTNIGNVTVDGPIVINDSLAADAACPALTNGVLLPTQAVTCEGTYTLRASDLEIGSTTNVASASGTIGGTAITSPSDDAIYPRTAEPAIGLTKTSEPADVTFVAVDDVITYSFTVSNMSLVGLTEDILIDDSRIGAPFVCYDAATEGVFGVGATHTCTATYTVTQQDLDDGVIVNEAVASTVFAPGTPDETTVQSPAATDTVSAVAEPGITLVKELVSPPAAAKAGDILTYRLTATNTGNQTLSAVSISDAMIPVLSCTVNGTAAPASVTLAPGEALICEGTYEVMQGDVDAQELINDASAMGQSPQGENVTDDAQLPATLVTPDPALEVVKTLEPVPGPNQPAFTQEGEVIQFRLTARNTGNVTLNNLVLEDLRTTNPATCAVGSLEPGASDASCLVSYVVTQEDVDAVNGSGPSFGGFLNEAFGTATANTPAAPQVRGDAELFVRGPDQMPAFSLEKTADVSQVSAAGDIITYTYIVTNSGNITLTAQPQVTDDRIANVDCAPIPSGGLAPGGTLRCSATYEVLTEDLDAGSITNIARVSSAEVPLPPTPGDETDSVTVDAIANPQLTLVKAADVTADLIAGQEVTYTYTVTNTGNVTLSTVTLEDQHTSAAGTVALAIAGDTLAQDSAPTGDSTDGAGDGVWGTLAPGDVITFSATYTVTQEDVDAGAPISNTATVSAFTPGDPTPVSVSTTRTVTPAEADPGLEVIKTVDLSAAATPPAVGDRLVYTITVENTGNLSLSDLALVDTLRRLDGMVIALTEPPQLTGGDAGTLGLLEVDEIWTYTAAHTLSQEDIDAGGLSNQAVATGLTPGGNPVSDTSDDGVTGNGEDDPTVTEIAPEPAIEGEKQVLSGTPVLGASIEFEIVVRNTGNVSLSNVGVASDSLTRLDGTPLALDAAPVFAGSTRGSPAGALVPGEEARYIAVYTLQQADIDAGGIRNSATVTGTPPGAGPITDVTDNGNDGDGNTTDDPTEFAVPRTPELTLAKRLDPAGVASFDTEGQVLTYLFEARNTGNVTLAGPVVVDDPRITGAGGSVICDAVPPGGLIPGARVSCIGTYAVTQEDIDAGGIMNTATASADGATSDPASATIPAQRNPAMVLTKTPQDVPAEDFVTGAQVTYTYVTTNTGNTTITAPISVTDNLIPASAITCEDFPAGGILPGGTYTCTGIYEVTATDVDLGSVTNIASATDGTTTTPLVSATIPNDGVPALSIVKSAAEDATFAELGDVLTYTFEVTNAGTRAFAAPVTVSDTLIGQFECFTPTLEDPDFSAGEVVTCSADYSVTQEDLDRGEVLNEAFAQTVFGADQTPVTSPPSAVTVTAETTPAITLEKTAAPLPIVGVGQQLTYTLTARNTGNQTLRNVVIRDDMLVDFDCQQEVLERDETLVCTGTAVVTQADIDAGNITNVADVSGVTPQGDGVEATRTLVLETPAPAPGITLQKTASPSPFGPPGSTLTFLFEVRNTGNVTLTDIVVTDVMDAGFSCTIPRLAPGAMNNACTFEWIVTQGNQDDGLIENTANVVAVTPDGGSTGGTDTLITVGPTVEGAIEATKRVDPVQGVVGTRVPFTLTVENTGNSTLRSITITDEMTDLSGAPVLLDAPFALDPASDVGSDGALSVGEVWTYTAFRTLTQSDVNAGGLSNQVTAIGRTPSGRPVLDLSDDGIDADGNTTDDPTVLTVAPVPSAALDVVKVVSTPGSAVGDILVFDIRARNVGEAAITALEVADTMTRLDGVVVAVEVAPVSVPTTLLPDEVAVWQATHTITQADIDAGGISNTATVSGRGPLDAPVSDVSDNGVDSDGNTTNDPTVQTIENVPPDYEILKTVEEIGTQAGEQATFLITVTNTGGQTLTGLALTDTVTDLAGENARTLPLEFIGADGTPPSPQGTLEPGEVATYRATLTLEQSDIDAGGVSNSVTGVANGPDGTEIPRRSDDTGDGGDDPTVAEIEALPSFDVVKSAEEGELLFPTIERVRFTITVTNTGNVTQTGIQVTDDLAAFLSPATLLSDTYPVEVSASGFGEDAANPGYDGVSDTGLLGTTAALAPGEVGTITVSVVYGTATGQPGAPNTASAVSEQLTDPTIGEVVVLSTDTDGDGIPDRLESATADRDGDGIPDREDYDPTGVFYCEDDGRLLSGGRISVSGNGFTQTGDGTSGPITIVRDGTQGSYQFYVTAAGTYTLSLAYPQTTAPSADRLSRGDLDVSSFLPDNPAVIGAGPAGDTRVLSDSSAGANPFYTSFTVEAGDPIVINNNIPVRDCERITDVTATKTGDRRTAVFGETVNFVMSFTNQGDIAVPNARIVDLLPSGLIYTPGSARVAGEPVEPLVDGRRLEWRRDLGEGETLEVRIAARVVRTGRFGTLTNQTFLEDRFGRRVSNVAEADVRIDPEHVFDCSDVIGRVFHDRNGNGYQDGPGTLADPIIEDSYVGNGKFGKLSGVPRREDRSEPGIAGVRLVTPDGILITTDEYGRYSLPCAALPRNIGSNFMLKLDTRTLPSGFRVTTENPRVVRLTAGKLAKLNFGVQQGRVVDIDLTAAAFERGTATPRSGLSGAVDGLIAQIKGSEPLLRLTYALGNGETPELARKRLREVEQLLRRRWRGQGAGPLAIEKTIAKTR